MIGHPTDCLLEREELAGLNSPFRQPLAIDLGVDHRDMDDVTLTLEQEGGLALLPDVKQST